MVKGQNQFKGRGYGLAISRILIGFIFLWAFFDKLLGLGFATPSARSWLSGASPTSGFLKAAEGPFADFFHSLVGMAWVDWLFMAGLLGLGIALLFGVAVRISAVAGSLLLLMMWAASLPLTTNPIIDEHLVYIAVLIAVASEPQQQFSLQAWWKKLSYVKQHSWLW